MDDRFFHHGGSLKPDSPSYIQRPADTELYDHIKTGDFCYVLTTRQMGKSSLMARTAAHLKNEGCLTAIIDLTSIGGQEQNTDTRSWHYGILHQITREINKQLKQAQQPALDFKYWWDANSELSSIQRFSEYFEDVLLAHTDKPITIFFDEIDSTITLPFTDDFFAAIRAFYNKRASDDDYQRLGFVLLGVATPADLINDTRRTPFNIGQAITLDDFTLAELQTLRNGFACNAETTDTLLTRIHHWTDGHPYLSQKLASLVQEYTDATADTVDTLVSEHFLHTKATQNETNLKFVDNRITQDSKYRTPMLKLYRRLLHGDTIADKPLSPNHNGLKLSGLVKLDANNNLKIRNRLYNHTFNKLWVTRNLRKDRTMLKAVSVAASIVALGFSFWYFYLLPQSLINTLNQLVKIDGVITEDAPNLFCKKSIQYFIGHRHKLYNLCGDLWYSSQVNKVEPKSKDIYMKLLEGAVSYPDPTYIKKVSQFVRHAKKKNRISDLSFKYDSVNKKIRRIYTLPAPPGVINTNHLGISIDSFLSLNDEKVFVLVNRDWWLLRLRKGQELTYEKKTYRLITLNVIPLAFENGGIECIDEDCDGVKVTYTNAPDSPSEIIYFDARNYPPIEGDPDELLKEWSEKLGIDPDTL